MAAAETRPARSGWQRARPVLVLVLLGATGWALAQQAPAMARALATTQVRWGWIAAATAVVLATYALLIQGWRLLLGGWGGELRYADAVRIWTIANLGRWIPGKVWSVGALGVLAAEQGVSGLAAAGAALLGTALNLGAGCAIAVLFGARALESLNPAWRWLAWGAAAAFVAIVLALPRMLPALLGNIARRRGVPLEQQHLPTSTLWLVTAMQGVAWVGYGAAFWMFARGATPAVSGNPWQFVALFSASYLAGYLVLIAPGGVGVREGVLTALLVAMGLASTGDAVLLGVLSRGWLTVLEIIPGLISLALHPRRARSALRPSG